MGIELYPYQEEAVKKMRIGSILCGGVGSGKSITSLAFYYKNCGGDYRQISKSKLPCSKLQDLYIVTTAHKRDVKEWEKELIPFLLAPGENKKYSCKVVIDSWNNITKYVSVKNSFFIFDEQRVVGSGAWVKAFLKIAKFNNWILLSATPGDCWMDYVPVFIANGFYKNRTDFIQQHVVYDWRCKNFPRIDRYLNTGRLIRLRNSILVPMEFERQTISHDIVEEVCYDMVEYKWLMKNRFNKKKGEPIASASELCYALRKIVNQDATRALKMAQICSEHDRVIVFYSFDYELDILRNIDYGEDVVVAEWNGQKHQELPKTKRWVYLVQYTAGCEGWNCVTTDTIVFYSQQYSYRVLAQAKGRIDRLNTPYTHLYYYHLVSKSKIDLEIARALRNKKDFNAGAFIGRK